MDLCKPVIATGGRGCFSGNFNVSGGANIWRMDVQARWIAASASGRATLPGDETMRKHIEAEKSEIPRRYPDSARDGLEPDPKQYPRAVERELR